MAKEEKRLSAYRKELSPSEYRKLRNYIKWNDWIKPPAQRIKICHGIIYFAVRLDKIKKVKQFLSKQLDGFIWKEDCFAVSMAISELAEIKAKINIKKEKYKQAEWSMKYYLDDHFDGDYFGKEQHDYKSWKHWRLTNPEEMEYMSLYQQLKWWVRYNWYSFRNNREMKRIADYKEKGKYWFHIDKIRVMNPYA